MRRPIIGIPQCLDDRGRWRLRRHYLYCDRAYAAAVERAGGTPIHVPIQEDVGEIVEILDGLLIPGGDDFLPPTHYPDPSVFDPAPAVQIDFDTRLLRASIDRSIPVLGICYGMQLLALSRGGHLHYHLPFDRPDASPHALPSAPAHPDDRHWIAVEPESRLASALATQRIAVNSLHHQAVSEPGQGLRVSARAEDGIIEGIEALGDAYCIGVQWHPEKADHDAGDALVRDFVAACAGRRSD